MSDISIADLLSNELNSLNNISSISIYFQKYHCRCTEKIFSTIDKMISYVQKYLGEIVGFYRNEDGNNFYSFLFY